MSWTCMPVAVLTPSFGLFVCWQVHLSLWAFMLLTFLLVLYFLLQRALWHIQEEGAGSSTLLSTLWKSLFCGYPVLDVRHTAVLSLTEARISYGPVHSRYRRSKDLSLPLFLKFSKAALRKMVKAGEGPWKETWSYRSEVGVTEDSRSILGRVWAPEVLTTKDQKFFFFFFPRQSFLCGRNKGCSV